VTQYDARIQEHPLHEALQVLGVAIDTAVPHADEVVQAEALERLRRAWSRIGAVITGIDPAVVAPTLLDALLPDVQNATSQLNQYAADPSEALLDSANAYIDGALAKIGFVLPLDPSAADGFRDALVSFRQSAGQHLRHLETEVQAAKADFDPLRQEIDSQQADIELQKGRLDTAIAEYQQQFSSFEAQRAQTFTQRMDEVKATSDAAVSAADTQIRAAIASAETNLGAVVTDAQSKLKELEDSQKATGEETLEALDELREQAIRVVQVIGNTGLTGGYQKVANEEQKDANRWRWIAIASFAVAALANGLIIWFDLHYKWNLTTLLATRVSVSVPLLALAGYAVAESRQHRHRERDNRQMELQLASIDPYLAQFPEPKQQEIKEGRVDRFFPGLPSDGVPMADHADG
jgi:tetratricopeptide (TPR) repeat protein